MRREIGWSFATLSTSPLLSTITITVLFLCRVSWANPVDAYGFGARGAAMCGAQTAATQDGGANYYNPAALLGASVIGIDFGYQIAKPQLFLNGGNQQVDESRGIVAALVVPGVIAGVPVAFGIGVFLPDERLARIRTMAGSEPRWALYDNRSQRLFMGANFAVRLSRTLSVGGGLGFVSRAQGSAALDGRLGFPDASRSDLRSSIDVDLLSVRYPQAGLLFTPLAWLALGLTYRHPYVFRVDESFAFDGDVGPAEGDPVVKDALFEVRTLAMDLFQPRQVAFGVAARLPSAWTIAADVTWQQFSAYENPSPHLGIDYDLKQFNDRVHLPPFAEGNDPGFHDVLVPRIGVEHALPRGSHLTWWLRGGYSYEPSPAPEQSGADNFVDNDKHTFSLGAGVSLAQLTEVLPRPFDIDAFLATTILPERAHRKVELFDPVGDYVSEGYVLAAGLSTRWRF